MISYAVYKIIHLTGVLMVFLALGGVIANAISGLPKNSAWRKPLAITHGMGLLLSLIGGFGLLARLGIVHGGLPGWALVKLGIWTVFAVLIAVISRKPQWAKPAWPMIILLGATAAYLAGSKPF